MPYLRSPMRQQGAFTERWASWRARSKAKVTERILRMHGRMVCEADLRPIQDWVHLPDWAHLFSRKGHIISEPWASHPDLCAGLCRRHHDAIDGTIGGTDLRLRHELQRAGILRLVKTYRHVLGPLPSRIIDPLGTIRSLVEQLEAAYFWDGRNVVARQEVSSQAQE